MASRFASALMIEGGVDVVAEVSAGDLLSVMSGDFCFEFWGKCGKRLGTKGRTARSYRGFKIGLIHGSYSIILVTGL